MKIEFGKTGMLTITPENKTDDMYMQNWLSQSKDKSVGHAIVFERLKIRKETTIDDYINLFYDKRGSKYFSKGTCLSRDMAEIKQRYNRFIKRTI